MKSLQVFTTLLSIEAGSLIAFRNSYSAISHLLISLLSPSIYDRDSNEEEQQGDKMANTSPKNFVEEIIDNALTPDTGNENALSQENNVNINQILPEMPVVCSRGGQFATVDHLEGTDCIKLNKDAQGQHHYIPTRWVTSTENGVVVVDRPGEEAMKEWSVTPIH